MPDRPLGRDARASGAARDRRQCRRCRPGPSWIAFARAYGTVFHTYTVMAPDPFVAPYYSFLLERTPKGRDEAEPRTWRKDEYPD